MKICSRCKQEKQLEDFYKDKTNKTGKASLCKSCSKAASKLFYRTSEKYKNIIREGGLKHRYGITSEEYWRLSEEQDHVCAICGEKGNQKYLHVDHDHNTGEIRGLLCKTCNHGLGNFKDNIQLLTNAIDYIR